MNFIHNFAFVRTNADIVLYAIQTNGGLMFAFGSRKRRKRSPSGEEKNENGKKKGGSGGGKDEAQRNEALCATFVYRNSAIDCDDCISRCSGICVCMCSGDGGGDALERAGSRG